MENGKEFPGSLPEIASGWSAEQLDLLPGEGFWARIEQIAVKGEMTRGLDTAMQGRSSPRIWLFLHEPGRGDLSASVAMSFARELAFRDQAALLLDGDDRDQALTRWSARVEAEGWIDLARYGTSVLTSGVPMPFVGRRGYFLGVGSFAPTEVTGKEIDGLITRLRRQADDLLIVAPADSLGRMWAPAASIRILCWDKETMTVEQADKVATDLAESECPLTAVVSFQASGGAAEKLVEEVFAEVEVPAEEPAADVPPIVQETPAAETEEPAGPVSEEAESAPEADSEAETEAEQDSDWRDLPLEREVSASSQDEEEDGLTEPLTIPEREDETGGETSRVFWWGALVAVVVLAAIGVYYFKFVRVPSEGHFEQIDVVTESTPPANAGSEATFGGDTSVPADPAAAVFDSVALRDSMALADSVAVAPVQPSATQAAASEPEPGPEIVQEESATPEVTGETVEQPAVFDFEPYQEPVGTKGWALHVYSLPDSSGTVAQVKELDRRGFSSAVRIFDLGEKGRWRRIYLGSFASRAEAKEAMPALLEKLKVDWAKAERFSTSAPE